MYLSNLVTNLPPFIELHLDSHSTGQRLGVKGCTLRLPSKLSLNTQVSPPTPSSSFFPTLQLLKHSGLPDTH